MITALKESVYISKDTKCSNSDDFLKESITIAYNYSGKFNW